MSDIPEFYAAAAAILFVAGLVLMLGLWGRADRFRSRRPLRALFAELGPLIFAFVLVLLCASIVWYAFDLRIGHPADLGRSILPGFFASLIEDIVFFSALGLIVFLMQRREFERSRNLEDRIDTLFNGKKLSAEELADLKRQVRKIGCDFRRNESTIDVRDYDIARKCLLLDVTRRWYVASYLSDESVEYDWRLRISPDDVQGISPLMEIYPSQRRTVKLDGHGKQTGATEMTQLHGPVTLTEPVLYERQPSIERIEPRTLSEYQSRYRGWQRLEKKDGTGRDGWKFNAVRHWDLVIIKVRNSLDRGIRVDINGKEVRTITLAPGAEQAEPLELNDLASGSRISVEFEVLD